MSDGSFSAASPEEVAAQEADKKARAEYQHNDSLLKLSDYLQKKHGASPELARRMATNLLAAGPDNPETALIPASQKFADENNAIQSFASFAAAGPPKAAVGTTENLAVSMANGLGLDPTSAQQLANNLMAPELDANERRADRTLQAAEDERKQSELRRQRILYYHDVANRHYSGQGVSEQELNYLSAVHQRQHDLMRAAARRVVNGDTAFPQPER